MSTLRITNLKGRTGSESPNLPDGAVVTGVCTATSFDGTNVTATTITATNYVGVPEGTNVLKAMLFS